MPLNVGVVLFSKQRDLLELAVHLDEDRLRALDPGVDVEGVREAVEALRRTCAGDAAGRRDERSASGSGG